MFFVVGCILLIFKLKGNERIKAWWIWLLFFLEISGQYLYLAQVGLL